MLLFQNILLTYKKDNLKRKLYTCSFFESKCGDLIFVISKQEHWFSTANQMAGFYKMGTSPGLLNISQLSQLIAILIFKFPGRIVMFINYLTEERTYIYVMEKYDVNSSQVENTANLWEIWTYSLNLNCQFLT